MRSVIKRQRMSGVPPAACETMNRIGRFGQFCVGGPWKGKRENRRRTTGSVVTSKPSFPSINYTHEYDAELAAAALKRRDYRMVGFVGKGALPHALVAHLKGTLTGTVFVDATDRIDEIKAIKSRKSLR